ncbi:MAG: TonB-dependent receptor, partial [Acidobacteria bacterium]|nr:TonB-dependent receptor [Acidobacteriota bacterium]
MNSRFCGLLIAGALTLAAQTPTGEIRGRVVDAAQAVIANANVEVTNVDTGVSLRTQSNAVGNFLVRNLIPGSYRLDVTVSGFKQYSRQPLEVRVGDVLDVEVPLEIGAVTERMTVTADTPLLETANATVGQVMDSRRIQDLPVPGNSAVYLLQFVPGAGTSTAPTNLWPPDALGSGGTTTIGGGRAGANEFAIDGTPMMTRAGGFTMNPPQEMVQELRVTSASYDASLGRFLGGHVNMVMKSGANAFHGSAIFQNLSRGLIARDLFTNNFIYDTRTGPITPEKIDNAWPPQRVIRGQANGSGPVWIPGLYDGHNRTFWTFGGDRVARQRAARNAYTVPTAAQRGGDFSALLALGAQYQIYDPDAIAAATGGRFSRQPLAGNIVPASRFDAIARKLLDYYPLPNAPGNPDGSSNYTDPNMADSPYKGYLGRADHLFNDQNRMFISFNMAYTDPKSDRYFHNISTGTIRTRRQRGISIEHAYTPSAVWILNFRYGLNRFRDDTAPPSVGFDLSTLGISSALVRQLDGSVTAIPQVVITGNTGLGGTSGNKPRTTYHNLIAQGTNVRGDHTLRAGVESRIMAENVFSLGNISPRYDFSQTWTRGPLDNSPAAPIGQGLASFLLGRPTGGFIDINSSTAEMSRYWGVFFQDDWKVTRRLSVNLGVRWDYDSPTTERYNRTSRGFAFGQASPVEAAAMANYARSPIPEVPASQFRVTGGLLFAGLGGIPRGLLSPDRDNLSPRIGLAYQLTSKTVLRAGYGVFFAPLGSDRTDASQPGFSQRTQLVPSLDNGITYRASMASPFPDGLLQPAGASSGLATFLGQSIGVVNPDLRTPYTQRWSFNLQQLLPSRFLADVGYMGTRTVSLTASPDLNPIPGQYLSRSPFRDQTVISFLSAQVNNPFFGIPEFTGTSLQSRTVARSQLLRPYPHFSGVGMTTNDGFAWYHSAQVRLERRFSSGYTVQASYTWSKSMEAVDFLNSSDLYPHRVVSSLDQTHVCAMSSVFELPFGKGKPFASQGRISDLILGGWSVQGTWQVQSGRPLSWGNILFAGGIQSIALPKSARGAGRDHRTLWEHPAIRAALERSRSVIVIPNGRSSWWLGRYAAFPLELLDW